MRLLQSLLDLTKKSEVLFYHDDGKTIAEHQNNLVVKTGAQQFQKLQDLGLAIKISLT